jgi:outer membrane protein OmpA-like peptidoglycan-associated protein
MSTPAGGARRDDWAELRRLLVDPELRDLAAMKTRLQRLERVSVEEEIAVSIKRNPRPLADALFPVMGPAIRRAVAEALKGLLQQIDAMMQQTLSPTGLRWRIEAWRTHTPLSQVIFKHTMVYRVEQVFLIHRETGLLLQHVAAAQALVQDPETVSSMLTAIQDFVRDSFKTKQGDTLDEISVGELTVWIEHGPSASIAGVIRGHPHRELRFVFDDALAAIHHEQAEPLEHFSGDTAPFAATKSQLEACLQFQKDHALQAREAKRTLTPAYALIAALLVGIAAWAAFQFWSQRRWNGYLAQLAQQPGIVVMHAENGWTKYHIAGLRDPLAADPQKFLGEHDINAASVVSTWRPYESLDPPFVLTRATRLLDPPAGVSIEMSPEGVLTATGVAPAQWIADARRLARAIAGVSRFDDRQVVATERQQLQQLADKVRTYNILFPQNMAEPVPESQQTLTNLLADVGRLSALGDVLGQPIDLTLVGHTDGSGTEGLNRPLSQRRADAILAALKSSLPPRGVTLTLATRGVSNTEPFRPEETPQDRAVNRRVSINIGLREKTE